MYITRKERIDQECERIKPNAHECTRKEQNDHECKRIKQNDQECTRKEQNDQECQSNTQSERPVSKESQKKVYMKVPYIGKPSILFGKQIKALLKNVIDREIQVVYTTMKVKDHFTIKDKSPKHCRSQVVYLFQCPGDPANQYVGYTNRTLRERVSEHLRPGTAVHDHIATCDSCLNKGVTIADFSVLKQCRNKNDTAIHEALWIKKLNPVLNRNLKKPGWTFNLQVFN